MEFRGFGGDVAVRAQHNAVNHNIVTGKENCAQVLKTFADGLDSFQNGFPVDSLFKIQASVISFRQSGVEQGENQGRQADAERKFHDG